jgi:hypothetical protein
MQARCYFCDAELTENGHTFKVGLREERICEECYVKTVNRRKALEETDR